MRRLKLLLCYLLLFAMLTPALASEEPLPASEADEQATKWEEPIPDPEEDCEEDEPSDPAPFAGSSAAEDPPDDAGPPAGGAPPADGAHEAVSNPPAATEPPAAAELPAIAESPAGADPLTAPIRALSAEEPGVEPAPREAETPDGKTITVNGGLVYLSDDESPLSPLSVQDFVAEVVRLVNVERSAYGLGKLSGGYTALNNSAMVRAGEIVKKFDHTRPNGTSCFTVLAEMGVVYHAAGENIAAGYAAPSAVVNAWMNSPGHRANILNGAFNYLGVGYVYDAKGGYRHYWVQMFTRTAPAFSLKPLSVEAGAKKAMPLSVSPPHPYLQFTWNSSNPAVATVTQAGVVKGLSAGSAKITAQMTGMFTGQATATVTVSSSSSSAVPATRVTLNYKKLTLKRGEKRALLASMKPANATDTITWSTSDPKVATVSKKGVVKAKATPGKAVITAETSSGKKATCTVKVKVIPATRVTLPVAKMSMAVGEIATLSAKLKPKNSTDAVKWSSDNPGVVRSVGKGVFEGIAPGKAVIRCVANSGVVTTCAITVRKPTK